MLVIYELVFAESKTSASFLIPLAQFLSLLEGLERIVFRLIDILEVPFALRLGTTSYLVEDSSMRAFSP